MKTVTKWSILLRFFREHSLLSTAILLVGLLNNCITLLLPVSLGKYYELVFRTDSSRGKALNFLGLNAEMTIGYFFAFFTGLIVARGMFEFVEKYLTGLAGEFFAKDLRERLFRHQLTMDLDEHNKKDVGKYLMRYGGDLKSIRNYLTKGIILFVRDVLFIGFSIWLLAQLNGQLTLIVVASMPVFALLIVLANRHLRENTKSRRDIRVSNLSFVNSRLSALMAIKVLNRRRVEEANFNKRSRKLLKAGKNYYVTQSLVEALLPVTLYGLLAVVLVSVYTISLRDPGAINGSVVITFILLLIYLRPVLRRLLRVNGVWQSGNLSFATTVKLLAQDTEVQGQQREFALTNGEIKFENVTYGYDMADEPVLQNVSFSVRSGQIAKLTGEPGSGKSTVFRLLMRLYELRQGRILVDGQDIAHASVQSYRKHITLVSEEVPLLGKTAYEAVAYSRKPETKQRAAALLSQVFALLEQPATVSLDDEIGESGANLSAGQRRALMLTRALLTNKSILLFDEPFGGLDESGRQGMALLLNQIADEGYTVLVIDHTNTPGLNVGQTICLPAVPIPSGMTDTV